MSRVFKRPKQASGNNSIICLYNQRKSLCSKIETEAFLMCLAWAQYYGLKSLVCHCRRKDMANGKGVVSNCESEGSRKANLWSDEQKSH